MPAGECRFLAATACEPICDVSAAKRSRQSARSWRNKIRCTAEQTKAGSRIAAALRPGKKHPRLRAARGRLLLMQDAHLVQHVRRLAVRVRLRAARPPVRVRMGPREGECP